MNIRKIVKAIVPRSLFKTLAPYGHLVEAMLYSCAYGFPARGMKVIGITGTNGKTTTSFLVHRMLQESGRKTGLMTTVAWAIGDDVRVQTQHMTNVPVPLLMKRLKAMKAAGVEWLVLETTSHALVQFRTWGVPYSVAVLTNISQDHLDYHGTMERYIAAKQRLFRLVQRNKQGLQVGIANADDRYGASFAALTQNSIMYGTEAGDLRATNIRMDSNGIVYDIAVGGEQLHIVSKLPGAFNVYNTLAAASVGRAVGLTSKQIEQGIAALPGVAGRLESVDAGQKFAVVVDYAHTPDALANVLQALRGSTKGKLIAVFGATGDRDRTKRGPMGEVVVRLADTIYLTDDETYTEDPDTIREAVYAGIVQAGGKDKTTVIADRLEAIRAAFVAANAGDTVLLAGLGHQDYRAMGGEKQPWDEREVARKLLAEIKK
ncbi:MAG TPA: UDP-N-acetylmuramoyl-L-alanyl-D-glutamate--2,6-diaminopimelate ligase [Candidatus Saccharimonadales bacterium]|nr:UDP-N-acetylmuramoyl-L-alanyl-D-glutamate--2,6-diaminopimelate ligase [Candidatus Saccharimonadales bacterium]